jgi:hypothetical protein
MAALASTVSNTRRSASLFELEALEGLPCGCVAAAYRARPWDVLVVSIEAKGPHCILPGHGQGQILRLGELNDLEAEAYGFDEEEGTRYTR